MTPSRAEKLRPEATSLDEARQLVLEFRGERRCPRRCDLRRELIRWRRFDLPESGSLGTAEVGYYLVTSRHSVGDRIRSGRLPARYVGRQDGNGYVYRVRCEDVRAAVEKELASAGEKARRVIVDSPQDGKA